MSELLEQTLQRIEETPYFSMSVKDRIIFDLKQQPEHLEKMVALLDEYDQRYFRVFLNLMDTVERSQNEYIARVKTAMDALAKGSREEMDQLVIESLRDELVGSSTGAGANEH